MKKGDGYSPNYVLATLLVAVFCLVVFLGQSLWIPASRLENLYLRSVVLAASDAGAALSSSIGLDDYVPALRAAFLEISGLSDHASWDTRYYNRRSGMASSRAKDEIPASSVFPSQSVADSATDSDHKVDKYELATTSFDRSAAAVAVSAVTEPAGTVTDSGESGVPAIVGETSVASGPTEVNASASVDDPVDKVPPSNENRPQPLANILHSAERPLAVYMFGDSQVFSLGSGLSRLTGKNSPISVDFTAIHSSGFIRADYYNWPAKLRDTFRSKSYDAVVMMLGMNDYQNFWNNRGEIMKKRTPEWEAAYKEKCRAIIDIVLESVPRLYWIGMPTVKNAAYNESLLYIDSIQRSLADEYSPDILIRVSIRDTIPGIDRPYTAALETATGKTLQVMGDDGSHFTVEGGQLVMKPLFDLLSRDFLFIEVPVAHLPE